MFNRGWQGVLWCSPSFKIGGKSLVFMEILECADIEPKTVLLLGPYSTCLRTPRVPANNTDIAGPYSQTHFWIIIFGAWTQRLS